MLVFRWWVGLLLITQVLLAALMVLSMSQPAVAVSFQLIGVFVLCLLTLTGFVAVERGVFGRLKKLTDRLRAIQAGQVGVRLQFAGKDEVALIAEVFNQCIDLGEERAEELKFRLSEMESQRHRLDMILTAMNTGVAYLDSRSNVQYINRAFAEMLGTKWPVPPTSRLVELLNAAKVTRNQKGALDDLIRDHLYMRKGPVELEFDSGRVLSLKFHVSNDMEKGSHSVLLVEDVSVHRNVRDLRDAAERDQLTRALNRRGFEMALDNRLPRLMPGENIGLICIDLDGFKPINDNLGHKAGDQVLKSVATLLHQSSRTVDMVARLGGDEFAIIVNRATQGLMESLTSRIQESFAKNPLFQRIDQNHGLTVSCSMGYSLYPLQVKDRAELIEMADQAMYLAKKSGKNCCRSMADLETQSISS